MRPLKEVDTTPAKANGKAGMIFILLVIYFIFEYIRPQTYVSALNPLKIPLILSLILASYFLFYGDKKLLIDPLIKRYLLFVFLTFFGLIFAANHYWVVENGKILLIYLLAVNLPLITILDSKERLFKFFRLWLVIHIVLSIVTIKSKGVGASSFLQDENDLALTLIVALPYAFYQYQSKLLNRFVRYFFIISFIMLILAIVATQSRGGFLGMAVAVISIVALNKNKFKNIFGIIILSLISLFFIPQSYFGEVESISDTSDSTRNDRFYLWARATHMFIDYPVFGVGSGNYPSRLPEYQEKDPDYDPMKMPLRGGMVCHSLYFSIISEYGFVGTLVFLNIILLMFKRLKKIRTLNKSDSETNPYNHELLLLSKAMTASLAGFIIGAAFITVTIYPHMWYMIGMLIAIDSISDNLNKK